MADRIQIAIGATGPINMADIGEDFLESETPETRGVDSETPETRERAWMWQEGLGSMDEDDGGWMEQCGFEIDLTGFAAYTGRYEE